ncbi:Clp protease N-terminal domain-containing protein [Streptomyces sp. NPDC094034]|uniref:Clp protease N-terminal domain-containing protein n=1 Tax=Streptomyces sp. NPDC094034 TaxID=3155309 RepID=UPI003330706E
MENDTVYPTPADPERTAAESARSDAEFDTEFGFDVIGLLVDVVVRALKHESRTVGTEDLLSALVMGDSAAGEAIAPGMRNAGALSGMVAGRSGSGWASDDHGDETPGEPADEHEIAAAWRIARWQTARRHRKVVTKDGLEWPEPSGALHACLLLALRLARLEAAGEVYTRHVARALLDLPDTRAREAYALRRLDRTVAYAALDALDARDTSAAPGTDRPRTPAVTLLSQAGLLGDRSGWLTRKLMSWPSQQLGDGSPVLFAVSVESHRQAVRWGRSTVEPIDLLLAILGLDRALSHAGRSLPDKVAAPNEAAILLRAHGVRPDASALSAEAAEAALAVDPSPVSDEIPLSAAAERTLASARLLAAEHHASSAGTAHLLAALLDDATDGEETPVRQWLRAQNVDVAALRADLSPRLSA